MRTPVAVFVSCLVLAAAACGGSDDDVAEGSATTASESPTGSGAPDIGDTDIGDTDIGDTDIGDTDTGDTDPATAPTTTSTTSTTTPTTTSTTTTVAPTNPLPVVTLADLPDLVAAWESGNGSPLELARLLIGFPLEIGPPDGSTPYTVDLRVLTDDPARWRWEWTYQAFMPDGSIQAIDAELPEGGPGTIEGRLYYDPRFEAFGWRYVSQVISDPSSGAGGPQSVNWAYETDNTLVIGAVETEPVVARAWVDEDIDLDPVETTPGHRLDVDALVPAGHVPVPLLAALVTTIPMIDGDLTVLDIRSRERLPDSVDAVFGLRYLEIDLGWTTRYATPADAGTAFVTALDGTVLQQGTESMVNEGRIDVSDPIGDGIEQWRQDLVLLDRYRANIAFEAREDGAVTGELQIRLEAERPVLEGTPAQG